MGRGICARLIQSHCRRFLYLDSTLARSGEHYTYSCKYHATATSFRFAANKASSTQFLSGGSRIFYGNNQRSIHGTRCLVKDYYDVLGVGRNSSPSEIKSAYFGLAKKFHPDSNQNDSSAADKFKEVQEAYEVLKDDEKRSLYDQVGHDAFKQASSGGGGGGGGFHGPFEDIFGGGMDDIFKSFFRQDKGLAGEDAKISVELSFMEAVLGCTKKLSFRTNLNCEACGGTGVPPGTKPETCRRCKGSGMTFMQNGPFRFQSTCSQCGGTGKSVASFCKSCRGERVFKGFKSVNVNIMAGIDNGETMKVSGSGGADPDGNQPGDLYVTIKVREDPVFRRDGANIHVEAFLNFTQAILGGTIQAPTLTGDVVLKVRPGTQPGQKLVLRNKGIRVKNSVGDQYVHLIVNIPTNLTQRQLQLIEEFAKDEQQQQQQQQGEDAKDAASA